MKEKLHGLIAAARERERAELLPHVGDAPPAAPGEWTARDQLAHLTAWREVRAAELEAVRTGGPGPSYPDDDDTANAEIYQRTHEQPAATIRRASDASWEQLARALEACSEDDLAKPRLREPDKLLSQVIPDQAYHLAEHLVQWHTEQSDEAAAEGAALFGYEVASEALPGDRGQGTATYNLGCFYARRGRAAEAMPLLRKGIELRPDLREWARQDSDLDPIRSLPELAGLLEEAPR